MGNKVLSDLKYTKEHEWAKLEGDVVSIGITDFAQSSLGDIVFVELPDVGKSIKAGQTFGVVESIKSVSDLYAPITGTVVEKNSEAESSPEIVNQNPYAQWLVKIKVSDSKEFNSLMSPADYEKHCSSAH